MKSTVWKVIALVAIFSVGLVAIYFVASNTGGKSGRPIAASDEGQAGEKVAPEGESEAKAAASGPQPRIEFEETTYDWGTVYQNSKVTHIFKFKNVGKADLTVSNVKSS